MRGTPQPRAFVQQVPHTAGIRLRAKAPPCKDIEPLADCRLVLKILRAVRDLMLSA
jgi:hypothetical protein